MSRIANDIIIIQVLPKTIIRLLQKIVIFIVIVLHSSVFV